MKQLVQNLKSGKMDLVDVPIPSMSLKEIKVRVHTSLISAGTEGSKVSTARKGYIGKAKDLFTDFREAVGVVTAFIKAIDIAKDLL